MREKALKRLSRAELLELLLQQTRQTELLQEKLAKAEELLNQKYLKIQEAGDLAHAVLAVNNVMEAAQNAAQQYLENMAAMEAETKERCEQMIQLAEEEAARIRAGGDTSAAGEETDGQLLSELHGILDEE